jgi:hypothetical protein
MRARLGCIALSMLALGGCIAVWGGAYHVESEDSSGGVIRYDHVIIPARAVFAHANEVCAKYQKVAVADGERYGVVLPGGSIDEISFSCKVGQPGGYNTRTVLWERDGGSQQEFAHDRYACMLDARSQFSQASVTGGFAIGSTYLPGRGVSQSVETIDQPLLAACMEAKGYHEAH